MKAAREPLTTQAKDRIRPQGRRRQKHHQRFQALQHHAQCGYNYIHLSIISSKKEG
jgi:hypothetical protein